jgi:hypothetical protein
VTTAGDGSLWRRFEHDPRDPAYAGMRASDRDRAVVHDALAEAYAEGRIDRDELEERTTRADAAKTYADLVPPLHDLMADAAVPTLSLSSPDDLQRKAASYYRDRLREAFLALLVPNLICWAIWYMTGHDGFIWPVFVLIPTMGNLLRVGASKQAIIDERIEKLEKRQAKALQPPNQRKSSATGSRDQSAPILPESLDEPEQA